MAITVAVSFTVPLVSGNPRLFVRVSNFRYAAVATLSGAYALFLDALAQFLAPPRTGSAGPFFVTIVVVVSLGASFLGPLERRWSDD